MDDSRYYAEKLPAEFADFVRERAVLRQESAAEEKARYASGSGNRHDRRKQAALARKGSE